MPIYEYYCRHCHTIFNFYSGRINTEKVPACPDGKCSGGSLQRQVSLFSISKGRSEADDEGLGDIDEAKLEQAVMSMAGEVDDLDEDDPKQAARMMRKLFGATGMKLGDGIEEAISRMESGEDPDKIEQDLGDVLEEQNPFASKPKRLLDDLRRKYLPPRVDEHLYEL